MGKYMRKGKRGGGVAVMDMSQSSMGVRTRARTLALERAINSEGALKEKKQVACPNCCYLELRSRKLEKTVRCSDEIQAKRSKPPMIRQARHRDENSTMPCGNGTQTWLESSVHLSVRGFPNAREVSESVQGVQMVGAVSRSNSFSSQMKSRQILETQERAKFGPADFEAELESLSIMGSVFDDCANLKNSEIEVSCGDNSFDQDGFSAMESLSAPNHRRQLRENTPSYSGQEVIAEAPGSSSRAQSQRVEEISVLRAMRRRLLDVPTPQEIEEFFVEAEHQEQRRLSDRYNYDFLNDQPLNGRYEWTHVV